MGAEQNGIEFGPIVEEAVLLYSQVLVIICHDVGLQEHWKEDQKAAAGQRQDLDIFGPPGDGPLALVAEPTSSEHYCLGVWIVNQP